MAEGADINSIQSVNEALCIDVAESIKNAFTNNTLSPTEGNTALTVAQRQNSVSLPRMVLAMQPSPSM